MHQGPTSVRHVLLLCRGLLVAREHHVRTRKLISVKCSDFYENKGLLPLLIAS
jgi:hypothetical protein